MNNIARVAIETLASALSGGHTIFTCSYDEAYCTPTEQAVKIALRTQQIIAHETGVTQTVDPMAGSYFVEHLTTKLETMAEEYLHKVEEIGGAIRAIEDGYFQSEIAKSAYEIQRKIEDGERVVVGVNQYIDEEDLPIEILKVDPALEKKQRAKLKKLKAERNNVEVSEALGRVKQAAENGENLVPSLIKAASVYATVGEMCNALRDVYGEYAAQSYI
jgi:methylmalonyl-CoA mutase N-terminal domain/subunit